MAQWQPPHARTDLETRHSSPVLTRSTTAPDLAPRAHRSRLAPEDAFLAVSLSPRKPRRAHPQHGADGSLISGSRRRRHGDGNGASSSEPAHRSRKRRRSWKKLLWVDRAYPDNHTDQATFLEQLQRNPRLQPYEFWPLVADTTIIVQHICSVAIFVVCFILIFQERVNHFSVVGCSSFLTFLGWLLWERWVAEDEDREDEEAAAADAAAAVSSSADTGVVGTVKTGSIRRRTGSIRRRATLMQEARAIAPDGAGLGIMNAAAGPDVASGRLPDSSTNAIEPHTPTTPILNTPSPLTRPQSNGPKTNASALSATTGQQRPRPAPIPELPEIPPPNRVHERLSTIKSALLISSILLGLSPILKSLTRSTSSDSIWAMCICLLTTNILFFDYSPPPPPSSSGVGAPGASAPFPASLSTNTALMASTMLASRLPSTGQVFSLTVLSIEVFGLFPVFRRYARRRAWGYRVLLTVLLLLAAGAGVGAVLGEKGEPVLGRCVAGMVLGGVGAALAMGGCSWWLIRLQKYKNEINGPWDAARPIIISRRY